MVGFTEDGVVVGDLAGSQGQIRVHIQFDATAGEFRGTELDDDVAPVPGQRLPRNCLLYTSDAADE